MAQIPKYADLVKIEKRSLIKWANELVDFIYDYTVNKVKDVYGRRFKRLDKEYKDLKASGKLKGVGSSSSGKGLFATGNMLGDLKYLKSGKSGKDQFVEIGWSSAESTKVEANANNGRVITDPRKAISTAAEKHLQKQIDAEIKKMLKKYDGITIHKL